LSRPRVDPEFVTANKSPISSPSTSSPKLPQPQAPTLTTLPTLSLFRQQLENRVRSKSSFKAPTPKSGQKASQTNGAAFYSMASVSIARLTNASPAQAPSSSSKSVVPHACKVTYANFVCNIRPQKTETHRVGMTAGGDKPDYPGDPSAPTVSMLGPKIHINSTISDAKHSARHLGLDIKNYFLGTPMAYYQYIRVPQPVIPQEVWNGSRYQIHIANHGYVYLEVRRGMYGLKEAAIIAFNQLIQKLAPSGYEPMAFTPGFWRHCTRKTTFVLCVDDFGVKYYSKLDALHLIGAIKNHYKLTIDWSGALYCGLTLEWHYSAGYVDVSMPGFVPRALAKFNHPPPLRPQHAPRK
jgi:hypothetical protein